MNEKTVLDFFRNDLAHPKREHLVQFAPDETRSLTRPKTSVSRRFASRGRSRISASNRETV